MGYRPNRYHSMSVVVIGLVAVMGYANYVIFANLLGYGADAAPVPVLLRACGL